MDKKVKEWRSAGKHLPEIMRDFHDQKEIFRAMHEMLQWQDSQIGGQINAVEGHCYIVDGFLWFMARHGYTLQKSRAKMDFESLSDNVAAINHERAEAFSNMLKGSASQDSDKSE